MAVLPPRLIGWPALVAVVLAGSFVACGVRPALSQEAAPPAAAPDFARHVLPILFRQGCSAGTCHGAFAGKAGFRLSLFASRPDLDYQSIRYDAFGRRLDLFVPESSLVLAKPSGKLGHGGGRPLPADSAAFRVVRDWIAAGAVYEPSQSVRIDSVRIEPSRITLAVGSPTVPLRVIAKLASGAEEDVTGYVKFESREPALAEVSAEGAVRPVRSGDAAILAHYAGHVAFAIVEMPGPALEATAIPAETLADPADVLLVDKLKRLNVAPSPACSDAEFVRRAWLDTTSTLPTAADVRQFLADASPDKRARLIDRLLEHELHHALWATRLCDWLGVDNRFLDPMQFHDWSRNKFARNVSWERIAYGLVCATTADDRAPAQIALDQAWAQEWQQRQRNHDAAVAAAGGKNNRLPQEPPEPPLEPAWLGTAASRRTLDDLYSCLKFQRPIRDAEGIEIKRITDGPALALQISSALLGVQLTCAQCHKHPHDKWSQGDFFGLAAVFSHVHRGQDPVMQKQGIGLSGVFTSTEAEEKFGDPSNGEPIGPMTLAGSPIQVVEGADPRRAVFAWMTAADNPYFARAIVNRIWAHYLGRGLFEPVDSQAAANPPSHPEVLDELCRGFVASGYDLRQLHRRILNLAAYQRSWQATPSNAGDERNYSHRVLRRLTAEQIVDAISEITGTPPALQAVYGGQIRPGSRVIEMALSRFRGDDWHVLTIFGKPLRVQACDCERGASASLSQAMYLYNDASLLARIADEKGRLKKLVDEQPDDAKLIEELFLTTLGRTPSAAETERLKQHLAGAESRLVGYQDVLWSLLNRQEFLVNH